jgi:hypothetical protein
VFSLFACDNAGGSNSGEKGLLYKKIDGVYTIYKYVDDGTGVTELNIADKLAEGVSDVRIQKDAFKGNDTLEKIVVPSTVTEIDKGAFAGMKSLKELTIPFVGKTAKADQYIGQTVPAEDKSVDSERTISHLFGEESYDAGSVVSINYGKDQANPVTCYVPVTLKKITVKPQGEYKIPMSAFNGLNKAVEIVLDGNVTEIGQYAFANVTQMPTFVIPNTVTVLHEGAFSKATNLKNLTLSTALVEIGAKAFDGTALTEIVIPANVTTIGKEAFKDSKVIKVTLSEKLTSLGSFAFYNCAKLEKVLTDGIANGLNIGVYAFGDCDKLTYLGASANQAEVDTIYVTGYTVGANAFDTAKTYNVIK